MRLVFMISSMEMGGAQRVAAALISHWVEIGYDVSVIVTFSGFSRCHYDLPSGVDVIYLVDEARKCKWRIASSKLGRLIVLRRLLMSLAPKAVVSFLLDANLAAILSTRIMGLPVLVSERSYPPRERVPFLYRILRWIVYPLANGVVFPTTAGLEWLETNIPRARGVVIPNPVTYPVPAVGPSVEPSCFLRAEERLILAVGRLVPGKGHDELIKAFAGIRSKFPDWRLAIAGDGPNMWGLRSLAAELDLVESVDFLGAVGNVGDWYERADVFVLPSHFEGFPNVLLEAMSYGCACISYDCDTGPREIIADRKNGILVREVGDATALSGALSEVLEDQVLRKQLSEYGKSVRETFSMHSIESKWDKLILARE